MAKKLALAFILLALPHMPIRLATLAAEVSVMNPGRARMSSGDARYWDALALEARLEALGWSVEYGDAGDSLLGVTYPHRHHIVVDERLHWDARFAVLAHEAGHTMEPAWLDHDQGEVFAECVAALLDGYHLREHARWLAGQKAEVVTLILLEWPSMYHAAAVMEDR